MPPIRAASVRFMPSNTAASDNNRRLWLLSFERLANRRSSAAEKSVRSLTADGMARISSRPSNQNASDKGILRESDRHAVGIMGRAFARPVGSVRGTGASRSHDPGRDLAAQ